MIVAATAVTGVYSMRISSEIRTGERLYARTGEKDGEHDLVEGGHEGEDAAPRRPRAESAAA